MPSSVRRTPHLLPLRSLHLPSSPPPHSFIRPCSRRPSPLSSPPPSSSAAHPPLRLPTVSTHPHHYPRYYHGPPADPSPFTQRRTSSSSRSPSSTSRTRSTRARSPRTTRRRSATRASPTGCAAASSRSACTRRRTSPRSRPPLVTTRRSPVSTACESRVRRGREGRRADRLGICSPYTDPRSFASLSFAIEGVGAAAYQGAAKYIDDKDTLGVAAVRRVIPHVDDVVHTETLGQSILSVEQRQAAWVSSAVLKQQPWNGPFETTLSPTGAYSLACSYPSE